MSRKNFHCHVTAQACVPSQVNFSHAACAQRFLNFVWSEFCAGGEAHSRVGLYPSTEKRNSAGTIYRWSSRGHGFVLFKSGRGVWHSSGRPLSMAARTFSIRHSRLPKFLGSIGGWKFTVTIPGLMANLPLGIT